MPDSNKPPEQASGSGKRPEKRGDTKSVLSLVKTADRSYGVPESIRLLGINTVKGEDVLLKPNFNTADPYPGSTHNETLTALITHLTEMGAKGITIAERSGPPETASVLRQKGIISLCEERGVKLINLEDLPARDWVRMTPEKSHWRQGFDVARPFVDSKCIVSTCCLKTHGFGGVFTISLKLAVGITHKNNMMELHSSFRSMRKMIAEINLAYTPSLILLDGIEAFVDGGPMTGKRKRADVIIAGTDRVAIDAVGVAVLKDLGSNRDIMNRKVFEQEQIAWAAELGLGVTRAEDIEIVTGDPESLTYATRIKDLLMKE